MKQFAQLSADAQGKALKMSLNKLLEQIVQGQITFDDVSNQNDLQARIETACNKAVQMGTPWFAHEYIMNDCEDHLTRIAAERASRAFYREPGELVLDLV